MDTNAGRFVGEESAEKWMKRLAVDEIVKLTAVEGKEMRVLVIGDRRVKLELLDAVVRVKGEELRIVCIENGEIELELLSATERMEIKAGAADHLDDLREVLWKDNRGPFSQKPSGRKRDQIRRGGRR